MTKKLLGFIITFILILTLTACGGGSEESADSVADNNEEAAGAAEEEKVYGVGDTWTVDGQWNFTIDSVEPTDERNEFDESNPAQVVLVKYHYENIGYEDSNGIMDGLFFDPDSAIDSEGNMCKTYPIDYEYAQETPVGAKCSASTAFGLVAEGSPITINISQYDGNGEEQTAKFVLEF